MKKKLFASILLLTMLTGCGNVTSESSNPTDNDTSKETATTEKEKTYTLKEALAALQDPSSRYSLYSGKYENDLDFDIENAPNKLTFGPHYYTKNAVTVKGEEENEDSYVETGYLEENGGVSSYTFDLQEDKLVRSELLTDEDGKQITSLSQVAPGFANIDASDIEVVDDVLEFKGHKKAVLELLDLFNISNTALFYLESFKMEFLGKSVINNLIFTAKINLKLGTGEEPGDGEVYYYVGAIDDFGSAETTYLEDFLANPEPAYTPSDNEKRLRRLFAAKNYTQYRDLDVDGTFDQFDYFTNQYYFIRFTDAYKESDPSTVAQYGDRGYLAINNKVMNYNDSPLVFIGCYLFYGFNDTFQLVTRQDPNNPYYAQSAFTQVYTDISYVMNYPNRMLCLNNFQNGTVNAADTEITYTDKSTLNDFVKNFNLGDTLTYLKKDATKLVIKMDMNEEDSECSCVFDLYIGSDQMRYFEYTFKDFGTTKVDFVDQFIEDNDLKMD